MVNQNGGEGKKGGDLRSPVTVYAESRGGVLRKLIPTKNTSTKKSSDSPYIGSATAQYLTRENQLCISLSLHHKLFL